MIRMAVLAGLALAAATAMAADIGGLPPPAPMLSPVPVYNWNGFYVGGHIGYAAAESNITETPVDTGITTSGSATANSFIGGAQVGWNWVIVPHVLIGFEWDVSGGSLGANPATTFGGGGTVGWTDSVNWFGTARGRLGYAVDNWLFYVTGGLAWAQNQLTRTQTVAGPTSPALNATFTSSDTRVGWSAGAGIEWGFAPNWSAKAEYLYISINQETVPYTVASPAAVRTFNVAESMTMQTVRLGVNYRFSWGPNYR